MAEKYLMLDLNDPKSEKLSEVLANKTCKKIINLLVENELSESDIASRLNLPLNTVEYNINKLIDVGLIEKSKQFFWSVKGKKIPTYKLANKKIVISTKSKFTGVISTILASGVLALGIRYYYIYSSGQAEVLQASANFAEKAVTAPNAFDIICNCSQNIWIWFLFGALFGLGLFLLFNKLKGGFFKK